MKTFQIIIEDRNYSQWGIVDVQSGKRIDVENPQWDGIPKWDGFHPIKEKLFTRDIFSFQENGRDIYIVSSPVKDSIEIPGILILENNKTFGRTDNKKRLLYKCIPNDRSLPAFIIPYEIKMGFSKVNKNKYVTFKFDKWKDTHPQGLLVQTLGNVEKIEVFYEYQLYCRSLHISITHFINKTRETLEKKPTPERIAQICNNTDFIIHDRRKQDYIFTIDPLGSSDFDDAFSIRKMENGNWKISVYIANVYLWVEAFNLWNSFSTRVATIYLPDRRRPMMPTILSELLCSLQKQDDRFAFVMDVLVDSNGNVIENSETFSNALIWVEQNYVYEDPEMIATDEHYTQLLEITKKIDKHVEDSHDLVSFWMVFMNKVCGNRMALQKFGIFRSSNYFDPLKNQQIDDDTIIWDMKEDTTRIIKMWNNSSGQYVLYNDDKMEHVLMDIKSYVHVTSPIRRLVDLLNQMLLLDKLGLITNRSKEATAFLSNWLENIDYINASMRSIRKVQTDCQLVERCFKTPDIMKIEHTGVVFDKLKKSDNTYCYMVYLEDIKLLSRITCKTDVLNYSKNQFKVYLFEDEDKIKNKIRLSIVE